MTDEEDTDKREIAGATFGMRMINYQTKKPFPLINIQSEKAPNRQDFLKSRCIIPANGFYEWLKVGKEKQPFYFTPKRGEFAFAGLWKKDEKGLSFCILTTKANETVGKIHDRMPVILSHNSAGLWLEPTSDKNSLTEVLEPYPDGLMTSWPVSKEVNSPKSKHSGLINSL